MDLDPHRYADAVVAAPQGRIDHRTAADFEAAMAPLVDDAVARGGALVLDFSGVEYISSVGLRVLMITARRMREAQATFVLAALQSVVGEIFTISRFDKVMAVQATVGDAIGGCSAEAQAAWRAGAP